MYTKNAPFYAAIMKASSSEEGRNGHAEADVVGRDVWNAIYVSSLRTHCTQTPDVMSRSAPSNGSRPQCGRLMALKERCSSDNQERPVDQNQELSAKQLAGTEHRFAEVRVMLSRIRLPRRQHHHDFMPKCGRHGACCCNHSVTQTVAVAIMSLRNTPAKAAPILSCIRSQAKCTHFMF